MSPSVAASPLACLVLVAFPLGHDLALVTAQRLRRAARPHEVEPRSRHLRVDGLTLGAVVAVRDGHDLAAVATTTQLDAFGSIA